jgi:hypothetical protein
MGEEQYRLSEAGIEEAVEILERDGFLPDTTEDEAINTLALRTACARYIEASVAKGDRRTDRECQDAIVIGYFEAQLQDRVRRIVN